MTADDIVRALVTGNFKHDELVKIRSAYVFAQNQAARANQMTLTVGKNVKFTNSRSGQVVTGTLTKVMRKNAMVKTQTTTWRVPMSMLSAA